ncbi:alpha/beta hydrolase [uncultured Pseudodesulfovibrio sp.]|uniref:alpha/beta fold hydrolase n=1 Tax=uncultured Pseudodesulfovibrio sp. TaxID=2035858 RepID=UPI0029C99130|nr:alpha/beta hydrolase [uncultured Pseudodesulfovibrio sp.]
MARLFPDAWKELHPDIYSRLPSTSITPSAEVIGRQYKALVNWPGTRERLATLNKETLVIVGQDDRITPPEQAMATVSLIEGAWLTRFKGADHWLMYQAGKDMASVIEGFLSVQGDLILSSQR